LQAKVAATLPVPIDGQPAQPPMPLVASRPSQPCATDVTHDQLVSIWEQPPPEDGVEAYQILAQTSGSGGFRMLLDDTGSPQPIVRLDTLSERTWCAHRPPTPHMRCRPDRPPPVCL
jgi:hypothetical protein